MSSTEPRKILFDGNGVNMKTGKKIKFSVPESMSAAGIESLIREVWIEQLKAPDNSLVHKRFSLDITPQDFGILICDQIILNNPAKPNSGYYGLIRKYSEHLKALQGNADRNKE